MDERDRHFLQEYAQFSGLNHIVTADALVGAGVRADETAARLHLAVSPMPVDAAIDAARNLNTGARVQSILVGRLVAELASAIEDVAALGWAIRERRKGLLATFLKSSVGDAATFLDLATSSPVADITELLRWPAVDKLAAAVGEAHREAISQSYALLPVALAGLGRAYRDPGIDIRRTSADPGKPDCIHVLLALVSHNGPEKRKGVLPDAFNKLKHRFVVIEDIVALGQLPGPALRYAELGRRPELVAALQDRINHVARVGLEMAAIQSVLADSGLDP